MKIPFGKPIIDNKEISAVKKILAQGTLVHGKKTIEFERNFKNFTKSKYSAAVSSCTAGMHLFYFVNNIGKGDEVIVPSQTHLATVHAIELSGAKPIFIDSEINTGNIDINQIEKKITKKTKVITVVHYLGFPVDMKKVIQIANKYKLLVLEDCALALGAKIYNKHVGNYGDAGVFSFYPVKHMTTGEGGMLITKSKKICNKIKSARAFFVSRDHSNRKLPGIYDCNGLGFNYRMNEIEATLGIQQLKRIPNFLKARKENFFKLLEFFKKEQDIYVPYIKNKNFQSAFYCFAIILKKFSLKKRNEIMKKINKIGIGTSVYYPHPVPRLKYYKKKYNLNKSLYKNATIFSDQIICLPVGKHVTGVKIKFMISKLTKIFNIIKK